MSIYKELNQMNIDLSDIEEYPLTELEQRRIMQRVTPQLKRKIEIYKPALSIVAMLLLSFVIINHQTIASMPGIAGLLEKWITENKVKGWDEYKNNVGVWATTELGQLTVQEVIINYNKILISSILQPSDQLDFSYRHTLVPSITVDGKHIDTAGSMSQSIKRNRDMYVLYHELTLEEPLQEEKVKLMLSYSQISFSSKNEYSTITLDEPWNVEFTATQLAMQRDTTDYKLNKTVQLSNEETIIIDRMITTPVSTTLYYVGAEGTQLLDIVLINEQGERFHWNAGVGHDDGTNILHYQGVSIIEQQIYFEIKADDKVIVEKELLVE